MNSLVLASTSTYRRALLQRLRIPFDTEAPSVDEEALMTSGRSAVDIAMTLAEAKVRSIEPRGRAVLGGDQLVDLDGKIMGKPGTPEAAQAQLQALSGQRHRLVTATALLPQGGGDAFLDVLIYEMHMRRLSEDEIERYVSVDAPLDCCGAYRIESLGIALFDAMHGADPTAIEGMPLTRVAAMLRRAGLDVP